MQFILLAKKREIISCNTFFLGRHFIIWSEKLSVHFSKKDPVRVNVSFFEEIEGNFYPLGIGDTPVNLDSAFFNKLIKLKDKLKSKLGDKLIKVYSSFFNRKLVNYFKIVQSSIKAFDNDFNDLKRKIEKLTTAKKRKDCSCDKDSIIIGQNVIKNDCVMLASGTRFGTLGFDTVQQFTEVQLPFYSIRGIEASIEQMEMIRQLGKKLYSLKLEYQQRFQDVKTEMLDINTSLQHISDEVEQQVQTEQQQTVKQTTEIETKETKNDRKLALTSNGTTLLWIVIVCIVIVVLILLLIAFLCRKYKKKPSTTIGFGTSKK